MATLASPPAPRGGWSLVIRSQRPWFDLSLAELWRYRDLVRLFVWRDFVATYKQTVLGPLWHIAQPLFTTLIFTLVFGRIVRLPTEGLPPFLFYLSGTVIWGYFVACVTRTATTFTANEQIFGKVYFPRLAAPLANVLSSMIGFAIQFVLFLGFVVYFRLAGAPVRPTRAALLAPLLVAAMAALGLGLGLIVAASTTRYRDLQQVVVFGVQLAIYATPVIYPLSSVPGRYRWIIWANPVTPLIESFRVAFLGRGTVDPVHLLYGVACAVAVLFGGVVLFNRVEITFMDTV
jgi:lipopolysaccharide transport system permease protein